MTISGARVWLDAARPRTLPAAAAPVLIGTAVAIAIGGFALFPAVAALAGAFLIQIGTNFANDLFDAGKGADGPDRIGPRRAVSSGDVSPRLMRVATVVAFAGASAFGAYLVTIGGWPIVAIGLSSIAAGVLYTGGPAPLGYLGLGDVFVFTFFGPVAVAGTVYVQAGHVPPLAWLCAIPAGLLSTAILVVNNVRDRGTDLRAGKRTLAVRFGRGFGIWEYTALVVGAFLCTAAISRSLGSIWALLPLLLVPVGVALVRALRHSDGPALNPLLGRTAQLLLAYAVFLSIGLVVGRGP